jgi:hypothetical protein
MWWSSVAAWSGPQSRLSSPTLAWASCWSRPVIWRLARPGPRPGGSTRRLGDRAAGRSSSFTSPRLRATPSTSHSFARGPGWTRSITAIRALALLVPLTAGAVLLVAGALRGLALPWGSTALALAGNVLLGFAVAAMSRTRTGEPGAAASAAVVLILILPGTVPLVSHWVHTFPASGGDALPSDTVWVDRPGPVRGGRRRIGQRMAAPRSRCQCHARQSRQRS